MWIISSCFYLVFGSPRAQISQKWLALLPNLRASQRTIHSLLCSSMPIEQEALWARRSLSTQPFKDWMKVILTIKTAFLTRWVKHSLIFDAMKTTWISAFYSLKWLHLIGWVLKTVWKRQVWVSPASGWSHLSLSPGLNIFYTMEVLGGLLLGEGLLGRPGGSLTRQRP